MKNIFFYTLLLVILNSILIVNQSLGINVILFTLPLLVFLYRYLKLNKLIKNKKGLLFFIPIIILSSMYFIYDNIFNEFNVIVIPLLYILMFIYTVNKPKELEVLFKNVFLLVLKPIEFIGDTVKASLKYYDSKMKLSLETKKKIKSVLIIIPVVIAIVLLLCMADEVFANMFSGLVNLFKDFSLGSLIKRIIIMIILFIYLNASLLVVLNELKNDKESSLKIKTDVFTMKVLITVLNIIYLVFDIIQIKSLFMHSVATNINYAEYARSGFFELMIISVINLVIILLVKKSKKNNYNKVMSILMVVFTLIIIISSFYRMNLYEQAYGYTLLRLGVYVTLFTEVVLLIPTVMYILKDKMNVLNYYVIIITVVYTFINLFSVDTIIARRNIDRYYQKQDIDIEYLSNYHSDNIPLLLELRKDLKEIEFRNDLDYYLNDYYDDLNKDNILEYNISRNKAYKLLKGDKDYTNTDKTVINIMLDDNASTGYRWEYSLSNKGIVDVDESYDYSRCPLDVDGCGGYAVFTIKSMKPGHTKLELTYKNYDDLLDRKVIYDIYVDDNYIIHETHEDMKVK